MHGEEPWMQTAGADVRVGVSLAVFDQGAVTVEHLQLPDRPAGQIDVDISAAAICGSDLHTVLGHRSTPARTALGHEGVGVVTGVDDGATDLRGVPLRRGDRVVFSMLSTCGTCDRCLSGMTMKCRSLIKYGHESVATPPHATGTLADRVRLHGSGWSVFVETTDDFDYQQDGPELESFFKDLVRLEGLESIIRPEEFHDLGYPRYEESPYVRGQYIIIPDIDTFLIVDDSSESTVRRKRSQPSHTHGYLPDHPRMHAGMILSGYGIRKGHRIGPVHNYDVAPTIAELLGLYLTDTEGQVLWEALETRLNN
jgi:hypothetical protein